MIRQAHLCAVLSLVIAAVATLLLYQPEGSSVTSEPDAPEPIVAERVPELTPGSPWIEPTPTQGAAEKAKANPLIPQHAFTTVASGEQLQDVARRVYGTADAADRLWRANRDTLNRPDSPVEPGTLLRTP